MGVISESAVWEASVLQIEVGDSVGGGPSAVANLQAQDLANRTKFLKGKVDLLLARGPVGALVTMPVNDVPDHCFECNGALISRATYPELFAVIGTTYGEGDGSTTFNLPDFRGRFLRGAGGVNAAAIGTAQDHMLQDHYHFVDGQITGDTGWHIGTFPSAGYSSAPPNWRQSSDPASGNHGVETRPVNFAVKFCIVYE